MGDAQTLVRELAAWQERHNQEDFQIHWRFTTENARIKLVHLYPNLTF